MEALTGELIQIVPQLALAALVIVFVVRWRKDDQAKDENWQSFIKELTQDYKRSIDDLAKVVEANTQAHVRCTLSNEMRDRLIVMAYENYAKVEGLEDKS